MLPCQELALAGRLVSRDAAESFSGASHCTASLSQPLPLHAVPWAVEAGQQHARQLALRHRLQLMSTAAASGCEVNLEAALAMVQGSVFPELLHGHYVGWINRFPFPDPGEAAIKAGHVHLLGWLVRRCPGLLRPQGLMVAAALHLDCAGLQAVWEALQAMPDSNDGCGPEPVLTQWAFNKVAESKAPDGLAKLQWMLHAEGANRCVQDSTAVAAARSGDLSRLRWLRDRGVPMDLPQMLPSALSHCSLDVVQWLVGEGGCRLPASGDAVGEWGSLLKAAARSSDGVEKLQWLQERGAPPLTGAAEDQLTSLTLAAAREGQADVVGFLLSVLQQRFGAFPLGAVNGDDAAASGSIPTVVSMRQAGCMFTRCAYFRAAQKGDLAMVRWLAGEAGVSAEGLHLHRLFDNDGWPSDTAANNRDLLQAVPLLLAAEAKTDGVTCSATLRGDLPLVQYLHRDVLQGRLPEDTGKVDTAARGGCEALVEWMGGQPGWLAGQGDSPYLWAAETGDLGTLRALRRVGVPLGARDRLPQAMYHCCPAPALRWLAEQGAPVGWLGTLDRNMSVFSFNHEYNVQFRYDAETVDWLRSLEAAGQPG